MFLPVLLLPAACSNPAPLDSDGLDSDGDGLLDHEEADLGTDANNVDTDGDGLADGEEADEGLDPLSTDTDGDTYLDPWEKAEGSDPLDPESRIYSGYWPYNPDKAAYEARSWDDASMTLGAPLPWLVYRDQYGDHVHVYDFADQGRPVVLDVSAMWCVPCRGLSAWVSGVADPFGFGQAWPDIATAVADGRVTWLTVIGQNLSGAPPSDEDLALWHEEFGSEETRVPSLGDDGNVAATYIAFGAWPTVHLFTETLELQVTALESNPYKALYVLQEMLDSGEL